MRCAIFCLCLVFFQVDTEVDEEGKPLNIPWDRAGVLMGHYVYNSRKDGGGMENTWHWDNLYIEPAVPIDICVPDARFADASDPTIRFNKPAPENAFMVFASPDITRTAQFMEVRFDQGQTWQRGERQRVPLPTLAMNGASLMPFSISPYLLEPKRYPSEVETLTGIGGWHILSETVRQDTVPQDPSPPDSLDLGMLETKLDLQGMNVPELDRMEK
ncbi:MAG: hypothetical protein AAF694_05700 [Bacteroidota bacterium]